MNSEIDLHKQHSGYLKNSMVVGISVQTFIIRPNVKNPENVIIQKKRDIRKIRPHLQINDNDDNNGSNGNNNDQNNYNDERS